MNIAEEIFKKCKPDAVAIIEDDRSLTYRDLDKRSTGFAASLQEVSAARRVPRIGLSWPDNTDYIAMALAILRAGGCFVPLAPELSEPERQRLIDEVALDAVVRHRPGGAFDLEKLPQPAVEPLWLGELEKLNPAFIRFTSGTTGDSKGIVISHQSLLERIKAANAGLGISADDRIIWVLPMSHHFAVSIMLYLWNGATIVLSRSHLAADLLKVSNHHAATVFYAAPFHFASVASCQGSWPSLRLAVSTTAALPLDAALSFKKNFGVFPAQGLGIIECGLPCLNVPSPEKSPASVGRPQPSFEVRLSETNHQLQVRGPGFMDAYLSPWRSRADILDPEGWFATGDIASIDDNGRVILLGRSQAVIGVSGMKFFPEEVEAVLNSHPAVEVSRVSGRPHPDFGMVPVAEAVLKKYAARPKPLELLSLCRRQLSRHKIPAEIRFVDSIPLTPSGKLKRT